MVEMVEFLAENSKEIVSYRANELTVDMNDVNMTVPFGSCEYDWEEYLKILVGDDISLRFLYGDKNWVTIIFE